MKQDKPYDAIILGNGIAGLGAAYALVGRGKKVLLVAPKKKVKGESTPASAGILDPFLESASPDHPFFRLKKKAFLGLPKQFRKIEKESGIRIGYARTGMLFTALTKTEENQLRKRMALHKPAGIPLKWLGKSEALRKWPYLSKDILGVLYYPTLGRVFPGQLQKALQKIVSLRGAKTVHADGRIRLLLENGQTSGLLLGKKRIRSSRVINASGCWADALRITQLRFPIFPVRGQVVVVRGKAENIKTVVHSAGGTYIVPWEQGTCLLGSTVERAGFNPSVQPAALKKIHRSAAGLIPDLRTFKPTRHWAGLRPCSVDHLPILGKTAIKGYYMAASYYRSGIVISLYAGELLAEGLFSKRFPEEMKPFSPLRFATAR